MEAMAQSRGDEQKNIPPGKMCEEYLDWFDLGQTCIKIIERGKPTQNSVKMPRDFKMKTGDGLGNMLSSKYLQTQQEYENSDAGMKPEEEPLNIDYELDSGINSDYDSTDSEREKGEWSDETEYNIAKECENNNRELDKSLESNEIILKNNKKLTQALEIEMAKYKQFKSKYNSAQQELQVAEITVKELAVIEYQLRESLTL